MRRWMSLAAAVTVFVMALGNPMASFAASPDLQAAKKCRKALSLKGRVYAKKRLAFLLGCVDKLLACEVDLELNGTNANGCRSTAANSCSAKIGPSADSALSGAAAAFDEKIGDACAPFGRTRMGSTAAGGLWHDNDATCATALDLATLISCIRSELEISVDTLVSTTKPRAALLLDNIGIGAGFPNLVRPPTEQLVVAATAAGSGALVNPGTINLPAGSALRVSGDAATLPCGGSGNNGKLTVTIGSGPGAQEFQLKEPYGTNEFALFGPYTVAGTLPYTIDLKDGNCMDTTSGSVSVP